ncbi:MAG: long-chain fatty acid--CoA ligase [Ignavibacteria bacterium]|nr:long-chain fatty acid--CoA ligase [Ignavibacteria bacterium]
MKKLIILKVKLILYINTSQFDFKLKPEKVMQKRTLIQLLINALEKQTNSEGVIFTKVNNRYTSVNRLEILSKALSLEEFFKKNELNRGDKIAIISENRTEWIITDIACWFSGIVNVPIYTTLSSESVKYILNDSKCIFCFVSNALQLEKVLSVKDSLPDLQKVICFNYLDVSQNDVLYFDRILNYRGVYDESYIKNILKQIWKHVNEEDLLTIIYTSGTTGIPKGVMLTHKNFYCNIQSCRKTMLIDENDTFLSYLPYSHIYERTTGYYLAFFSGSKIYYAKSIDSIGAQMPEAKPTVVITVPRLLDKIYNKLMRNVDEMPEGFRKKIFVYAIDMAKKRADKTCPEKSGKSSLKYLLADKLVYKKIKEKTGGKIRFFVSGGGALNKSVGLFFDYIGIETLEGYGMTETSPVISVNVTGKNRYGTVGKPLDGVEVKIARDGEILVKGELVMKGYYNDEEETKRTIVDGWLHTGDLGKIDEEGHIIITDRKKSLFKSSGGKYIAPAHIEDLIKTIPYIDQVLIIGNERMYVTALIVPDKDELISVAKKTGIAEDNYLLLLKNKKILEKIENDINEIQKNLALHEKVRKFTLIEKPFSIENGELTPTLKIKRKFVEEQYADLIEKMYHKV